MRTKKPNPQGSLKMDVLSCTVGGQTVALHIRRTAKKNIIARPRDTGSLNVSIPPRLPLAAVSQWAQTNQNALAELLRHAYPAPARPASALPEQILFGGHWHSVKPAPVSSLAHDPAARMFRLPVHLTPQAQTELLRRHLIRTARETLLPKLAAHGTRLHLVPAAAALTNAKTLWPQPNRHPHQLAAGRRARKRAGLCVHPRAVPLGAPRPQPRLLDAGAPLLP